MTPRRLLPHGGSQPVLRLFSVHEDIACDGRTQQVALEMERCSRHRCQLKHEKWKLDLLAGFVRFREITIEEACQAHVMVLSFRQLDIPDAAVSSWFEAVCERRRQDVGSGLLLALLGDDEDERMVETSPVREYLGLFAQRAGLDFVWVPGSFHPRYQRSEFNRRFEALLPALSGSTKTTPSEWTPPVVNEESFEFDDAFDWVALP